MSNPGHRVSEQPGVSGFFHGRGRGAVDASRQLRRPHSTTINPGSYKQLSDTSHDDSSNTAGLPATQGQLYYHAETQIANLEKDVLHSMAQFINEVTTCPGSFEYETELLLRDFNIWAKSIVITKNISAMILEQSVAGPNFRYNGARLCNILIRKSNDMHANTFWENLNYELNEEKEKAMCLLDQNPERLRGFLLFVAELFVQLEGEHSLCVDILFVIQLLLARDIPENVKCVCQTLKLSGRYIDLCDHGAMNQIMEKLLKLTEFAGCDKNLLCQILSVAELRRANWGYNTSEGSQDNTDSSQFYMGSGPIFYGPDGTVLSAEERKFLEEPYEGPIAVDDDDVGELWDAEDPMNELDDAFEEFLKFSNQE